MTALNLFTFCISISGICVHIYNHYTWMYIMLDIIGL